MNKRKDLEYFIVEGWYDQTGGLHNGIFYGAYCYPEHPLLPVRCVLLGEEAKDASFKASIQGVTVLSEELREENEVDDKEYPDPVDDKFQAMDIAIENPKGSVRSGVSEDGHAWRTEMKYAYGFLKKVNGADGEGVDVYIGPNKGSKNAYIVHQNDPKTGMYDEDKVMLGFDNGEDAKKAYLAHYDSPEFFGTMTEVPMNLFKDAVNSKIDEFKWKSKKPQICIKIEEMVCSGGIAERPALLGAGAPAIPKRRKKPKMPHSNKIGSRIPTISQTGGILGGNRL